MAALKITSSPVGNGNISLTLFLMVLGSKGDSFLWDPNQLLTELYSLNRYGWFSVIHIGCLKQRVMTNENKLHNGSGCPLCTSGWEHKENPTSLGLCVITVDPYIGTQ